MYIKIILTLLLIRTLSPFKFLFSQTVFIESIKRKNDDFRAIFISYEVHHNIVFLYYFQIVTERKV